MPETFDKLAWQRTYYDKNAKATIARHRLGVTQRVEPPANVERRDFSGPCFLCNARGECRHRSAHV